MPGHAPAPTYRSRPDRISRPRVTQPKNHRLKSILGGSAGNLVEWFDWYVYSAFGLYFAPVFFPKGNSTAQLMSVAAVFAVGFLVLVLVAYLVASGLPALQAATIYGAMGMVSIAGMIGAGFLAERIGEIRVAALSYGGTIAGVAALACLSQEQVFWPIAGFIALFGTMQGSRGPLVAVLSLIHI